MGAMHECSHTLLILPATLPTSTSVQRWAMHVTSSGQVANTPYGPPYTTYVEELRRGEEGVSQQHVRCLSIEGLEALHQMRGVAGRVTLVGLACAHTQSGTRTQQQQQRQLWGWRPAHVNGWRCLC
jgi:hypothetical protein